MKVFEEAIPMKMFGVNEVYYGVNRNLNQQVRSRTPRQINFDYSVEYFKKTIRPLNTSFPC